jgi:small subunit ribosomal protein S4
VTSPSFRVQPGQVIAARPRAQKSPIFAQILEANGKYAAPKWLKVDAPALKAEVVANPTADDAEQGVDMRLVVEFYSRN